MVCATCEHIASLLEDRSHDIHEVVLGTVQDVVHDSSCEVHPQLLMEALRFDSSTAVSESVVAKRSAVEGELYFPGIGNEISSGSYGWQKLGTRSYKKISLVDNKWIDIARIKAWKDLCLSQHGADCHSSGTIDLDGVRPAWLIDCIEKRLVCGDAVDRYLALSYVWGQTQRFKATQATLGQLQQPGALSVSETGSLLPAGIRDALSLTLALQERYLWVDCLCIAQDDEAMKQQEILKMAGIYHNAALTVVLASDLDSDTHGLPGISRPRNLKQRTFKLNEEHTIVQHLSSRVDDRSDPWSKRAWTFQEGIFSRRILEFQQQTVFWRCQQAQYFEDVEATSEDDEQELPLRQHLLRQYPNFPDLARLIQRYTTRDLTYVEDAHTAFSSILATIGNSFKGGFISGLPVVNFDLALLWLPMSSMTLRAGEHYTGSVLPTWSWIAWQGQIDTFCWYKGHDHVVMTGKHLSASERIAPLVSWSIPDGKSGISRFIHNEWSSLRKTYMAADVDPPQGWTRHTFDAYDGLDDEENDLFIDDEQSDLGLNLPEMGKPIPDRCYSHESLPNTKFWYPIPMVSRDESTPRPMVVPHICCQTRLARLYGAERSINGHKNAGAIVLRDSSGHFAGVLRPNTWSPISNADTLRPSSNHNLTGTCFDLVEVSLGYCYEDHWTEFPRSEPSIEEWKHPERPCSSDDRYEFYNVMWVIWRDGIAYRRGIGRAEKRLWESLKREHISLTLG